MIGVGEKIVVSVKGRSVYVLDKRIIDRYCLKEGDIISFELSDENKLIAKVV